MDNALKASWNETKAFNSSDDGELRCVCTEKPFYIRTMGLPNINGRRSGCYNNSVIQIEVMNKYTQMLMANQIFFGKLSKRKFIWKFRFQTYKSQFAISSTKSEPVFYHIQYSSRIRRHQ